MKKNNLFGTLCALALSQVLAFNAQAQSTVTYTGDANWGGSILFKNSDNLTPFWQIGGPRKGIGANTPLSFHYWSGANWTTSIAMSNNGNVGIGTETPNEKFEVMGRLRSNSIDGGLWLSNENEAFVGNAPSTFGFWGATLGWNTFAIQKSTGNVGIGTSTPNAQLQLSNQINNRRIVLWENGNNGHQFDGLGINAGVLRYQTSAITSDHAFYAGSSATTSNELFRIKGNGNVGIGTANPDAKLTVAGNVKAREVEVRINAGADFVFEPTYNLPPLSEVEKFVKTHKHLPGIQSEKDMQENGLNLNEMNIKLLQKVEELTLYTIELEKRLKQLEEAKK